MDAYDTATFDLGFFGGTTIFSTDPAVVKHMLTGTTFFNYEKGEFFNGVFDDFLGEFLPFSSRAETDFRVSRLWNLQFRQGDVERFLLASSSHQTPC